jgi:hypothetical protein
MRFKRTAIASVVVGALLAAGTATITAGAAPPSPFQQYKCERLKGTIVSTLEIPGAGVVTGSLAGDLAFTSATYNFDEPSSIRSVIHGTITPTKGEPFAFVMDLLAINFTASGLVGGGILNIDVVPHGDTFSAIHVTLGPMDDRVPDGAPAPTRVITYEGQRCRP